MGNKPSAIPSSSSDDDSETSSVRKELGTESYVLGEAIARGKDSFCHWGEHLRTGQFVAVKKAWKCGFSADKCFRREVENMEGLEHPGIVRMMDHFEDAKFTYIVMELMPGGTLAERILEKGPLPDETAAFIFRQILNAVVFLHDRGICHRDLKPSNILMASGDEPSVQYNVIKIGDFGLSRRLENPYENQMSTHCGSLNFAAPEVHQAAALQAGLVSASARRQAAAYSAKVDMWSLGAALYNMLSGAPPFDFTKTNTPTMLRRVIRGEYEMEGPQWGSVCEDAKDCVRCLMQVDARQRPTAAQCLWHLWLVGDEAKALLRLGDAVQAQCARAEFVLSAALDMNLNAAGHHLLEATVLPMTGGPLNLKGRLSSWWSQKRIGFH